MDSPTRSKRKPRVILINRRVVVSLVLLVAVFTLISSNSFWRWMYPIHYQQNIQQAARSAHVDPLLVAAVIRTESKFQTHDVSHAGAIGLMQLMPETASWVAVKMQNEHAPASAIVGNGSHQSLAVPAVNIALGSWYIHYLIRTFHGNQVVAIAAYNAGPKRVQEWLTDGAWDGQLPTITQIPVGETRHFVDRVFYNYTLYQRIYGNRADWRFNSGRNQSGA